MTSWAFQLELTLLFLEENNCVSAPALENGTGPRLVIQTHSDLPRLILLSEDIL